MGEDNLSYGYGGTGKVSVNNKFFDYGEPYSTNDTILCCIDLDANPKVILFVKNGRYLGVAFRLGYEAAGQVFYPHVTVKNMRLAINFGMQTPLFPPLQGFSLMSWLPASYLERGAAGPLTREECEVIMMVGLPGAGKTVWASNFAKTHPEKKYNILGTNTIMDKMKVMGLMRKRNYHGRWDALIKQATEILNKEFKIAERKNRNYILDQTNVYFTARRRKMNNFRGYRRIAAVVVNTNEVLKQRTEKREREEGKVVPESAVFEMKANFSLPEIGEVFDDVWFVEEDRVNAMKLVAQFQHEGKEFKEGEKKRKTCDETEPREIKRVRPEHGGPPSFFQRGPSAGGPSLVHPSEGNFNSREPRGVPKVEPYQGPPLGNYGGSANWSYPRYDDYRPPQRGHGPAASNGPASIGQGRYDDYEPTKSTHGANDFYGSASGYGSYTQGYDAYQKPSYSNGSRSHSALQHDGYSSKQSTYSGYQGVPCDAYGQYYGEQNAAPFKPGQHGYYDTRGIGTEKQDSGWHYRGYGGGY